jgi:hypothetical protein
VWIVSESGERLGSYDPNAFHKYRFFLDRLEKSEVFAVRLYMLCVKWGDDQTCALIKSDVLAAAMSGSSEAIYCILSSPKLFSPEELSASVGQAVNNINNICDRPAPAKERKIQMVEVEKLAQALESYDSKYEFFSRADIQEKIDYFEAFGDIGYFSPRHRAHKSSVHVHDSISDDGCIGSNFNTQSITIVGEPESTILKFHILNSTGANRVRVMQSAGYVNYLLSVCERTEIGEFKSEVFRQKWILDFEAGDLPGRSHCVSFERAVGDESVGLIPDLYYFSSRGFKNGWINGDVPPWKSKTSVFTWRGITTGGHDHTVESIATLPRLILCAKGSELGPLADFGITQVVHARSEVDAKEIEVHLKAIGMWKDHMPQHIMGRSKFLLEIDGSANSWGFLAKLIMGCCVLKVDSPFEQWFYQDLKPWIHYIPIARDLSNLPETMEWCLLNEPACREIASAGQAFAEARTFDREMKAAAATMAAFARPLR